MDRLCAEVRALRRFRDVRGCVMTPKELTALKFRLYDALVCDPKLSGLDLRVAWLLLTRHLNAQSLAACFGERVTGSESIPRLSIRSNRTERLKDPVHF